jgi:hypothetical protein
VTPDVVFAHPLTCRMPSGVVDTAWVKRDGSLVWVHPHLVAELVAQGARRLYVEVTPADIPDVRCAPGGG